MVQAQVTGQDRQDHKHHRGMGGTAWVYLQAPEDEKHVTSALRQLEGVQLVLTRSQAAQEFNLMPSRIGDLVVLGDRDTVFGDLETAVEVLPKSYLLPSWTFHW
jgi:phosphonoacetate hydrolase